MHTFAAALNRLRDHAAAFRKDARGNIAIIFGISLIPLMGAVGAAVDYSRANMAKASLQAAVDSATLATAKSASSLGSDGVQTNAANIVKALFKSDVGAATPTVTTTYTTTGGTQLTVNASSVVPTSFMGIFGIPTITVSTTASAAWSSGRLRVALVLDVTGSMANANKLTTMKSAAKDLIDQLAAAATVNGDVYISLVPFAKDVNIGASNYKAKWVRWDVWEGQGTNQQYQSCTGHGRNQTCTYDHSNWDGCVTDRDQSYDTTNDAPTGSSPKLYVAEQYVQQSYFSTADLCPQEIIPLTYDWSTLKTAVGNLVAQGGTNQAVGLQAGFQTLTADPFTVPTKDSNYNYSDVIIILSDGLNTQDRWYGDGMNWASQVDDRQKILCDNIKKANITIYAIQVNTDGEAESAVLKYCASTTDKFYPITQAADISTTFTAIGTGLTKLRLSK